MPEALTFVFADLESSTRLWELHPDAMSEAMERHDAILRRAVERADGQVVKLTGDGLMAVFPSACDGVTACLEAQLALQAEQWPVTGPLRVRMGVHTGEAQRRAGDFFGPPVNRTARIMSAAHGGQVLLSARATELAREGLPAEADLRDMGEHRLKDLSRPEHLFQLVHPALPADFPPLATLAEQPNNLPTQASEFIGRETQLGLIRDLLETAGVRLLTLTGPGGIGKTRLALQAAADQIDRFQNGVYFVDVSPARDAAAVLEAIHRTVGLPAAGDEQLLEALTEQLRGRRMLLLLDNFEQVVEAADDVAFLLERCPELKVLVTSREALRVRGEHLLSVPPLSAPPTAHVTSVESIAACEAVRLFVERAREARPSFALTDENAEAVAEITSRLDGLPLAIELAAARLQLFSPAELRDRLRSRLELLGRGPRDLPQRQRTLRSTIEWSYELLDADERHIFQLLAVFAPATVDAIEAVAARVESCRGIDVVDRLASLVDKSLVRSVEGGDGQQRLSMLETIREYAVERLEETVELTRAVREAHAEHFSELASNRRDRLYGSERERTLDELEAELGNLMIAWRFWVEASDFAKLERLLDALWVLHDARGWYHAAAELANDLLAVLATAPSTPERARDEITLRTTLARALMAIRGYTQEVEEMYERALELSREAGELPRRFSVLRSLASFHLYLAEFDKGVAVGRELLELADEQDDAGLRVEGHMVLGASLAFTGDTVGGLAQLDEAIRLFEPRPHGRGALRLGPNSGVVAHTTSAFLLWLLGQPGRAVGRADAAVRLADELRHPFTLAYALFHVGFLDLWRREWSAVRERASRVLEVAEEHEYQIWAAVALVLDGAALSGLGEAERGVARVDEGIALYQGLTTPPVFWPLLLSVRAGVLERAGRPAEGFRLAQEAMSVAGEGNILYPDFALLEGDLLLAAGDVGGAEQRFQRVYEAAGELGVRMPQLRAATRLARLRRAAGDAPEEADAALRAVYETFIEDFDVPDLVEARAILESAQVELGSGGSGASHGL